MKKFVACSSIISMSFVLAACQPAQEADPIVPPTESAAVPVEPAPTPESASLPAPEEVAYADIAAAANGKAACFLGAVNGDPAGEEVEVKRGQTYALEGWTADENLEVPLEASLVVANGERGYVLPTTMGPDLRFNAARTLGKPALTNAGYMSNTDFRGVPEGDYLLFVRQTTNAGTYYCPVSSRKLLVR